MLTLTIIFIVAAAVLAIIHGVGKWGKLVKETSEEVKR